MSVLSCPVVFKDDPVSPLEGVCERPVLEGEGAVGEDVGAEEGFEVGRLGEGEGEKFLLACREDVDESCLSCERVSDQHHWFVGVVKTVECNFEVSLNLISHDNARR